MTLPSPPSSLAGLQAQLDEITAQTRLLVPAERLTVVEDFLSGLIASGIESRVLKVGDESPEFSLIDATTGKAVHSPDILALGPLVVSFFRGRWCPYCMTELETWQKNAARLRELGALVVGISPQLPRQNDFTADRHGITFPLLSDPGLSVAAQFGLVYDVPEAMQRHFRSVLVNLPSVNGEPSWRLPLPATFAIGTDGRILFAEAPIDHRTRAEPEDVFAALAQTHRART